MKIVISIIMGIIIGILPTILLGITIEMWEWWVIAIPSNVLVYSILYVEDLK